MRQPLLIISLVVILFLQSGHSNYRTKQVSTSFECQSIQKNFKRKLREIAWDEGSKKRYVILDDIFFNTYLKDIHLFSDRGQFSELYYHSVPDIQSEKCFVVVKSSLKNFPAISDAYYLVEIGHPSKLVTQLANYTELPFGIIKVKSFFQNDSSFIKTEEQEFWMELGDSVKILQSTITSKYALKKSEVYLESKDSIGNILTKKVPAKN